MIIAPLRTIAAAIAAGAATLALLAGPAAAGTTAPAQVFLPNPVADLGLQTLTDRKDADYFTPDPFLRTAYHRVTLTQLDGSGTLTGDFAEVRSSTGPAAVDDGTGFVYTRDDDRFEQAMGYFYVTEAQRYLRSLGFGTGPYPAVNARRQVVRINQFGGDNSFYRDTFKRLDITLGKGGVDDAEDGEVILHEYGHSVQDDQVPGFGTTPDAGAIGEGFGDYLAVTVGQAIHQTGDPACVADWDSVSYTSEEPHCLRRVDGDKVYPGDLSDPREVHDDGEIWSRALWDIHSALGATLADTNIVRAQFAFTPDISMPDAAAKTIETAALYNKARAVRAAFAARGLA